MILVKPGFQDPAYPDSLFYCWHCALIEGILTSFPDIASKLIVKRVEWPKPRSAVIALVGDQNQSLPLLVLSDGSHSKHETGEHEGRTFVAGKDAILRALSERHGFPDPHP